jgi:hypothetical protein
MLCSEDCPCDITDKSKFTSDTDKFSLNVDDLTIKKSGAIKFLECKEQKLAKSHKAMYVPFLRTMEAQYNCAGICKPSGLFLFSDVSKGSPGKVCKDVVVKAVHERIWPLINICLAASALGALGLGLAASICFFNKQKPQTTWEKYRRMAV